REMSAVHRAVFANHKPRVSNTAKAFEHVRGVDHGSAAHAHVTRQFSLCPAAKFIWSFAHAFSSRAATGLRNWIAHSFAYNPPSRKSSSCVPCPTIRPDSMT